MNPRKRSARTICEVTEGRDVPQVPGWLTQLEPGTIFTKTCRERVLVS